MANIPFSHGFHGESVSSLRAQVGAAATSAIATLFLLAVAAVCGGIVASDPAPQEQCVLDVCG